MSAEMHLANARQSKTEDSADEELPSTSGIQLSGSSIPESSNLRLLKVLLL